MEDNTPTQLTLFAEASPASHFQLQESKRVKTTRATSGRKRSNVFAIWDPDSDTPCWKTSQVSFLQDTSMKSSLTWPKQGWMRDGLCSELTIALPRTEGSDSGFWRTPMVADGSHNHCLAPSVLEGRTTVVLTNQVKMVEAGMWPTPDTQNHRDGSKLRKDNNLAQGGRHGVSLHHAVWMWPTPTQDMVTNRIKR